MSKKPLEKEAKREKKTERWLVIIAPNDGTSGIYPTDNQESANEMAIMASNKGYSARIIDMQEKSSKEVRSSRKKQ